MKTTTDTRVECPICRGAGMLSNGHPDPQLAEDGDCHGCRGDGKVTRDEHAALLDHMTDDAARAAEQRLLAADVEDYRDDLALARERDAEWWA